MADASDEHLTEYERAIYYYTMPRVTRRLPVGVLVVYSFIVIQAIIVIAYGLATEKIEWTQAGTIALGICMFTGVVVYLSREFIHEIRERTATAVAKTMPDVDSQFDDIPDPFAAHLLLRYPVSPDATHRSITNNKGQLLYQATLDEQGKNLTVTDHNDAVVFDATLDTRHLSFSFESGSPSRIDVQAQGVPVARVHRHSNFGPAHVDIECLGEPPQTYEFRDSGIYCGEDLIGRIYEVRQHLYLDIQREHFRDGILSFFLTMGY